MMYSQPYGSPIEGLGVVSRIGTERYDYPKYRAKYVRTTSRKSYLPTLTTALSGSSSNTYLVGYKAISKPIDMQGDAKLTA